VGGLHRSLAINMRMAVKEKEIGRKRKREKAKK